MRGPLDRLARLDPTGVLGPRAVGLARQLPGVTVSERVVQRMEGALLRELSRRLDEAIGRPELTSGASGDGSPADVPVVDPPGPPRRPSAAELMDSLLRASTEQDPETGERALVELIIGELVPDEARLLAALGDGSAFPLLDVVTRSGQVLLANVSTLGREAGAVLPDRAPVYLAHMLSLGLAERGGEDSALRPQYETLLADPAVIKALAAGGLRRPRVVRGTVRISGLGRSVWAAASTAERPDQ